MTALAKAPCRPQAVESPVEVCYQLPPNRCRLLYNIHSTTFTTITSPPATGLHPQATSLPHHHKA